MTRARGWILKNTIIGRVLDIKVCNHEDQYTIEVPVKSLFQYRTASSVRIVNGVDKYVTESMLTEEEKDIASEKPIAKARPRHKPTATLTSFSVPVRERKRIDIEQLNNCIKSRRHAWMTTNLKKKKLDKLENCTQFAHKLF